MEDIVLDCTHTEWEFIRLLQANAEKMANAYLVEHKHTQLSYQNKDEQERLVAVPKGILLDKMITFLHKV